jgi:hypothetical protein
MHPAVEAGLENWQSINHAGYDTYTRAKLWASIEVIFLSEEAEPIVRLTIGRYSLTGVKQIRHKTRVWNYDYNKNEAFHHDMHHS